MPNFPKTEKIEVRLRQDLADRLPVDKSEKNAYISQAVEHELDMRERLSRAGKTTSPAKSAAARENGKKSGQPKNNPLELNVTKDGKPRTLRFENLGKKTYTLVIVYPDGQQVLARHQPNETDHIPDIKFYAEKNGFQLG